MFGNNEQKPPRVLVVDDQETVRFFAREAITQNGLDVQEAKNGIEALAAFERYQPDIVLLDVMMPMMDGFTVCKWIRLNANGHYTPILMMTGLDDEESITRAYDAGATDFISKPLIRVILTQRIRYMLRAKETADELRTITTEFGESQARLGNAERIARIGNWEWNRKDRRLHYSTVCRQILGLEDDEYKGTYDAVLEYVDPDDRDLVQRFFDEAVIARKSIGFDHNIVRLDGSKRSVYHALEATVNDTGRVTKMTGTLQDTTDRKESEDKIRFLAYYDPLTGLPNRTFLKECFAIALNQAKRNGRILGLLYLDLDNFKRVNDTLGHSAGDRLLCDVSNRLERCVRKSDSVARGNRQESLLEWTSGYDTDTAVARLGGDEFFLLLREVRTPADAARVARRITQVLSTPFKVDGTEIFITTSIGITIYPTDGDDEASLFRNADVAMYHAKDRGRNNYQFFTESLNATASDRLAFENDLRKALDDHQLFLVYQPKIDIQQTQVTGVEALIRWQHPDIGMVSPMDFIPVAEETGLIVPIGEWVLHAACAQIKAWEQEGLPAMQVAVNVSSRQFIEKDFARTVERVLHESGVEPKRLKLELTEGLLMEDTERTTQTLSDLKALGVYLSMDDFGTGYSSLSYLKRFPIDELKIDRSFINDLTSDSDNQAIAIAIISLSHSLDLRVVAEGVETPQQLAFLRKNGCYEIQGYLISAPVPSNEISEFLDGGRWLSALSGPHGLKSA